MSEENKKKGKELEHFIKEDNEELELLDWEKDKDIIITIMENLGFKQTKNKTLFVKDLQNGDSIFCEFKDDKLGKFWTKKGSNIHDINEYIAFRALQEGKGSISIEGGNCIINIEEEGKIFTIEIQKQYDIDDTVRKRMKDESLMKNQKFNDNNNGSGGCVELKKNKEIIDFIKTYYPFYSNADIIRMIKERTGIEVTYKELSKLVSSIRNKYEIPRKFPKLLREHIEVLNAR